MLHAPIPHIAGYAMRTDATYTSAAVLKGAHGVRCLQPFFPTPDEDSPIMQASISIFKSCPKRQFDLLT